MLNTDDIQYAIAIAAKGGLGPAVIHEAFQHTSEGWVPRSGCLSASYSSGEAVVCAILLCFYFEMYGTPSHVEIPSFRDFNNSVIDLIWPGAWYFVSASRRLSEESSWKAIKSLLPENS
jgi:hypothetical protein